MNAEQLVLQTKCTCTVMTGEALLLCKEGQHRRTNNLVAPAQLLLQCKPELANK